MSSAALGLFAPNSRACEGRAGRADLSDVGRQRHPQTERPAGAAWAAVGRRRRFLVFGLGANAGARAFAANDRSCGAAAPGARCEVRGIAKPAALISSIDDPAPVTLVRAESSCARGAPSQRRRSAERPTFRPTRPARAGWGGASPISFSRYSASGRTIDHAAAAAPGARWELRGIAKQAALKDQRYRTP